MAIFTTCRFVGAALVIAALFSQVQASCRKFLPSGCQYELHYNQENSSLSCFKGSCDFNTEYLCPLYVTGKYEVEPEEDRCQEVDWFLHSTSQQKEKDCNKHCCESSFEYRDIIFEETGKSGDVRLNVRVPWTSDTCKFYRYRADQVLQCLPHKYSQFVIIGDSIMRQLHNSVINMFRGNPHVVDYDAHFDLHYEVSLENDFTLQGPKLDYCGDDYDSCREKRHGKLFQRADAYKTENSPFSSPSLAFSHLFDPKYKTQRLAVNGYRNLKKDQMKNTVFIMAVHFWEFDGNMTAEGIHPEVVFPSYWKDTLELLADEAGALFVATSPVERTGTMFRVAIVMRNEMIRQWVNQKRWKGKNVYLIDFERLSQGVNAPSPLVAWNWHFQCFLTKTDAVEPGQAHIKWTQGEQFYQSIWPTEDGQCGDEINRAAWQMIFNQLC